MAKKQEVEARHYDVVLAPHMTEPYVSRISPSSSAPREPSDVNCELS